jgi:hypothetical protein
MEEPIPCFHLLPPKELGLTIVDHLHRDRVVNVLRDSELEDEENRHLLALRRGVSAPHSCRVVTWRNQENA